ncbi:MAG: molybdopterin molybdotransferase MoeA [Acidimicrobiales bacterium]
MLSTRPLAADLVALVPAIEQFLEQLAGLELSRAELEQIAVRLRPRAVALAPDAQRRLLGGLLALMVRVDGDESPDGRVSVDRVIALEDARSFVLSGCEVLPPARIPLADALGLVVAGAIAATELVPPFDNTAMDGFAVRAADTPGELAIVGTLAAGAAPTVEVGPGQAIRIMTGAPMPAGADAVVMVERTSTSNDGRVVQIEAAAGSGDNVRRAGDDLRQGDVVIEGGSPLTPAHLGVLASIGVEEVMAHPRPTVGVLSTGDELVEGAGPLRPGQIRDSNRRMLLALLAESGCVPVDLGLARDDEAAIAASIRRGVERCDALLTSGGVSMGDFDYVKSVLGEMGEMRWMQVAIRPAKPLAFGTVDGVPVLGLPGNPVSSLVSFELFARPALRRMTGWPPDGLDRPRVRAVAAEDLRRRPDGKAHFVRVAAHFADDGRLHVRSTGAQGSHQLAATAAANALAVLPDGEGVVAGGEVDILLLRL